MTRGGASRRYPVSHRVLHDRPNAVVATDAGAGAAAADSATAAHATAAAVADNAPTAIADAAGATAAAVAAAATAAEAEAYRFPVRRYRTPPLSSPNPKQRHVRRAGGLQ